MSGTLGAVLGNILGAELVKSLGLPNGGVVNLVGIAAGQSNIANEFTQYSGAGEVAFNAEAGIYFNTVDYRNAAIGGSTLASWWSGTAGINATNLIALVDAQSYSRSDVNFIRWNWGEQNGADGDSKATIKANLLSLFNYFRTELGSQVIIVMDMLGRRTTDVNDVFWQNVKEAQLELIAENSFIYAGAERYDQTLADTQHIDQAGYEEQAERDARRIASLFGKIPTVGTVGMKIASASLVEPDTIELSITHDGGTDFTPTTGIEGITASIDGTQVTPVITRKDASTLTMVLPEGTAPTDVETTIAYSAYGQILGLTTANVIDDNATNPLPLRTGLVTATNNDPVQSLSNVRFYIDPRGSAKTYSSGTKIATIEGLKGAVTSAAPVAPTEGMTYDSTAFAGAGGFTFDNIDRDLLVGDLGTAGGTWTIGMAIEFPDPLPAAFYFFGFGASGGATDAQALMFMAGSNIRYAVNESGLSETLNGGYLAGEKQYVFFEFVDASELNLYSVVSGIITKVGTINPRLDYTAYDYILMFNSSSLRLAPVGASIGSVFVSQGVLAAQEKTDVFEAANSRFNLGLIPSILGAALIFSEVANSMYIPII